MSASGPICRLLKWQGRANSGRFRNGSTANSVDALASAYRAKFKILVDGFSGPRCGASERTGMLIHVLMLVLFVLPMFLPNLGTVAVFITFCLGITYFLWPSLPSAPSEQAGPLLMRILIGLTGLLGAVGGHLASDIPLG